MPTAKQENLFRGKMYHLSFMSYSFYVVRSRAFCRVSSEIKKLNFEIKKPLRRMLFAHANALHGEVFHWAAVSTEYEPLMQIS